MTPNFDAKIEEAHQIIKSNPQSHFGHALLGEILYTQEEFDKAVPHLMRAVELISKFMISSNFTIIDRDKTLVTHTFHILGDCYLRLGNYKDAQDWFKKALDLHDDDATLWARYGQSFLRDKKIHHALQPYRRAVSLKPSEKFFWELLHECYLNCGRSEAWEIQEVLEKDRDLEDNLRLLIGLCIDAADYDSAGINIINLFNTGKSNPHDRLYLAHIAVLKREYEEAIKILEKYPKEVSKSNKFRFLLSRAYIFKGRWHDAEKCLNHIMLDAKTDLNETLTEFLMSRTMKGASIPEAKFTMDTAARFLHLLIDIRKKPTQRFRLHLYNEERNWFMYYPDIFVPSGTTVEDLIHWSRTNFDELFPPDDKYFCAIQMDDGKTLLSGQPWDLATNEPGAFSYTCLLNTSYEDERDEVLTKSPGGQISTKTSQVGDPILTGDFISLMPWEHIQPVVDHRTPQMYDDRFRIKSGAAGSMSFSYSRQFFDKRDYLVDQLSEPHVYAGSVPKDESESYYGRLALAEYYLTVDSFAVAEYHLRAVMETHPKELSIISRLL